jgi:hypothetical protein
VANFDIRYTQFLSQQGERTGRFPVLGRKVLRELETLVTLTRCCDGIELVSSKWDYSHRRGPGRPRVMKDIVDLILRMAQDNPLGATPESTERWPIWDMTSDAATIANILIEPAPERDKHTSGLHS